MKYFFATFVIFLSFYSISYSSDDLVHRGSIAFNNGDYKSAYDLFLTACNNQIPSGCNEVAKLYEMGKGVNTDHKIAKEFYKKSALLYEEDCNNNLNVDSCTYVASMYRYGIGVKTNIDIAKNYYKKAYKINKKKCKN